MLQRERIAKSDRDSKSREFDIHLLGSEKGITEPTPWWAHGGLGLRGSISEIPPSCFEAVSFGF